MIEPKSKSSITSSIPQRPDRTLSPQTHPNCAPKITVRMLAPRSASVTQKQERNLLICILFNVKRELFDHAVAQRGAPTREWESARLRVGRHPSTLVPINNYMHDDNIFCVRASKGGEQFSRGGESGAYI